MENSCADQSRQPMLHQQKRQKSDDGAEPADFDKLGEIRI
jgi:hypothetical protein